MSLLVAPRWTNLPASPVHASVRARTTAIRSCRVSRSSSSTRFTVTYFVVAFFVISAAASRGTSATLASARARAASTSRIRWRRAASPEQPFISARPHLGVDARSSVEDRHRNVIVLRSKADRHRPGAGRLEGVLEEVHQSLLHPKRVDGDNKWIGRELFHEPDVGPSKRDRLFNGSLDDTAQIDRDPRHLLGAGEGEEFRNDVRSGPSLRVDLREFLQDGRIGHPAGDVRGQQGDVREGRVDLVGDERGDLAHGSSALALEEPPLIFLLRGHVAGDDLHVRVGPFFPDHPRADMEESPVRAGGLQMDLERFHDGPVVEQVAKVLAGALRRPRGGPVAAGGATEGRRVFYADQSGAGGGY